MKFLKSWLEDYIDLSGITDEALVDAITNNSSEVEEIEKIEDWFGGKVVIGQIKNVRPHPNADRLKIFDVVISPDSKKSVQIVSAAPNVEENMIIPVALNGAKLPGLTIVPREMRGEKSEGMCCGKSELLQEDGYSSGLWELEKDGVTENDIGRSICTQFPEIFTAETLIDIKVLPDKFANIANYIGMAIEISICLQNPGLLKGIAKDIYENSTSVLERAKNQLENLEKSDTPFKLEDNVGYIKHIKILELDNANKIVVKTDVLKRLFLTDTNILGQAGDLSNYLMLDCGQPSHYFDLGALEKYEQGKINWKVEEVENSVNFKGLGNFSNVEIQPGSIVLKQNHQIISMFGVVGGDKTKVTEKSEKILLEIPTFKPEMVRKSSFVSKVRTDASKLWAAGADEKRIAVYILNLIGVLKNTDIDLKNLKNIFNQDLALETQVLEIDYEYLIERLGANLTSEKIDEMLSLYGTIKDGNLILKNQIYGNIKDRETMMSAIFNLLKTEDFEDKNLSVSMFTNDTKNLDKKLIEWSIKQGFDQVITRPFTALKSENQIEVLKPQNVHLNALRDNLVETLLVILKQNLEQKIKNPHLFELNKIYVKTGAKNSTENVANSKFQNVEEGQVLCFVFLSSDPYEATTLIQNFGRFIGEKAKFQGKKLGDFGQENIFKIGNTIGKIIEISNKIKKSLSLPLNRTVFTVEFILKNLELSFKTQSYFDQTDFPIVTRSLSLVINRKTAFKEVKNYLQSYVDFNVRCSPIERLQNIGNIENEEENINPETEILNIDLELSKNGTISSEELAKFEEYVKNGPIVSIR